MERAAQIQQKWAGRGRARTAVFFGGVWDCAYLYDLFRLSTLFNDVHLCSAFSLVISDVDGQLSGLQPLEAVGLTAAPNINVLHQDQNDLFMLRPNRSASCVTVAAHRAQVNNKAVPLVEAGPLQVLLRRPDGSATFDVQQTLHVCLIGHHMMETRGNAPFLGQTKQ